MTNLSPAAASIVLAFDDRYEICSMFNENWQEECLAAVLRAAADRVVPPLDIKPQEDLGSRREAMEWGMNSQTQLTRHQLLAIAAELEAQWLTNSLSLPRHQLARLTGSLSGL